MTAGSSSPLADPRYRRLFAAQVIALIGTGLTTVALALLAFELAGGSAGQVLGTALALKMVAYVLVAPAVGGLAHRLPRRGLLVGLDAARAAMVGALPFVTEVWQVYLLIFLLNACSAGFTPSFQATIPDLLPEEDRYTRALSLSRLAYDLENLLSPLLAVGALLFLSYGGLFLLNAQAFLISALLVVSVRFPPPQPATQAERFRDRLAFGTRVFFRTPRLRALLALYFAVALAGAMVIVNTVVYVREGLGGSEAQTALAFAASGAGSMLVALALPRLLDRLPDRPFLLCGGALLTAGLLLGTTAPGYPGLLIIWCLLGAGASLVQTPAGRLIRRSCHPGDRAALFAAQFGLSHACWLIAYPLAGWLGSSQSPSLVFLLLALPAGLATLLAWRLWPRRDPSALLHDHPEMAHEHLHVHDDHHRHEHEGWEGPEPHRHPHRHTALAHRHDFVIDDHHPRWP